MRRAELSRWWDTPKKVLWYTTYGAVTVEEACFLHKETKRLFRPFSEAAGVRCRGYSLPLERAVADLGADVPFGQVAAKMKEHYGIDLAEGAPRTLTERVACALTEADCLPVAGKSNTAEMLIVETDGGMVPIVDAGASAADARKEKRTHWREAKVCIAQRQGEAVPKAGVTMGGPLEAGAILKRLVEALGFGPKTRVHCVGDGAAWISDQIEELFGTQGTFLVDLFHVCEYLTPASKVFAPDDPKDWVASQKAQFLQGQACAVVTEMKLHVEPASVDDSQAPVRAAWRYFSNRLDQLDYPRALTLNLPVGSGAVESSHRYTEIGNK